jgi:hypothetical protein
MSDTTQKLTVDFVTLLLSIQMLCQPLDDDSSGFTELYAKVKQCYSYAESHNAISLRLLQACVLIALYEAAHAIYPAAYLTVGHCARLGHAFGIHDRKNAIQLIPIKSRPTECLEA